MALLHPPNDNLTLYKQKLLFHIFIAVKQYKLGKKQSHVGICCPLLSEFVNAYKNIMYAFPARGGWL